MAYTKATVPLRIGGKGFTGTKSPSLAQPREVVTANGIGWDGGSLIKEGGITKYNSTVISGTPKIISGYDYWPDTGNQRMLVSGDDGKAYRFVNGSLTHTLATGLTVGADDVPMWLDIEGTSGTPKRDILYFSGSNQVQNIDGDGTTMGSLGGSAAPDWGTYFPVTAAVHDLRTYAGGNFNEPHKVYWSILGNGKEFAAAGSGNVQIYPGVGDNIIALTSWRGRLVVFKYPRGIFLVDFSTMSDQNTYDPTVATNYPTVSMLSPNIGCAGPRAFCHVNNDVYFMTPSGEVKSLAATDAFGDGTISTISQNQDISSFIRRTFDLSSLRQTRMIFYDQKQEVYISLKRSGSSEMDARMVLDLENFQEENYPPRWRYTYGREEIGSMWTARDNDNVERPHYGGAGGDAGFIWNLDVADIWTKDGSLYASEIESVPEDLSDAIARDPNISFAVRNKNFEFLEIIADPEDATTVNVDILLDDVYSQTISYNIPGSGASFPLNLPVNLGGRKYYRERKTMEGSGRTISLRIRHDQNAGFSIGQFLVSFNEGDESIIRPY